MTIREATSQEAQRGLALREARQAKRLSQRALGVLANVPQPVISSYEKGDPRYHLTDERFARLMQAIDSAPEPPEDARKRRMTKPARVSLPPRLADQWEGMSNRERSAVVKAGMEYLGR